MKQFLALKASAGSGKTFALTVRYISLLLMGAKPSEILTLTFTNKAANEMSERIYNTLLNLGEDAIYLQEIMKETQLSKEEILTKKRYLLKNYLNAELSIYTIDKFVNKILREFCGYASIHDDFEIKEDDIEHLSYKFLTSLELPQFEKLIEFSYYESKKFNSIFELFQILIEKNEPFNVVPIQTELITLQKEQVLTLAYKIKEHILNCEVASKAAINSVDFNSFDSLMKKGKTWLTKAVSTDSRDFKKCSNEIFEGHFQELKQALIVYYKLRTSYSLSSLYELFVMFKKFKAQYNKNKNYFTFNDISNLVHELLSTKIDKDFLYFRLDSVYQHILMDEFQDTSLLQYRILEPLIQELLSGNQEKEKSFFYVGDTKQSIYRFRGGKRELFDYVSVQNPQVEVEVLNTNYRSSENIVSFVNDTFRPLRNYEYYDQESVIKGGYVEVCEDDALESEDKFSTIALKIDTLLKQGVDANNIAILTYTNEDVLNLYSYLGEYFPTLKIATEMTSRLVNQENVKSIINLMKYLYYKEDIYKANFNAIIGKKPWDETKIQFSLEQKSIVELIHNIAQTFDIIDDNVIRFIEVCTRYTDMVDFIYEIDKLETPIENKEQVGLQILTIFKSKGLEFDTVLLLDRIKRKNADKSALLFEYDKVSLSNVYYKVSGLEHFEEHYANALQKEKQLTLDDELNILYVALTRAKNNLVLFKKKKSSVFDLLSLGAMSIGTEIITPKKDEKVIVKEKVQYKPMDLGRQNIKSTEHSDDSYTLHAKYFGLATHYCLEMMKSFSVQSLSFSMGLARSRYSSYLQENDFNDIEHRIALLIQNETFQTLINDAVFTTEQTLLYKNELKIIDLLIEKDKKLYIIDYKTTQEEHVEHLYQVAHYKKAIGEICDTTAVQGFIVYLKRDEVVFKSV